MVGDDIAMSPIKVALLGAAGRMGKILTQQIAEDADFSLVARIDAQTDESLPRMIASLADAPDFDVLIDFSVPDATQAAFAVMRERRKPWLVATTGLSAPLRAQIEALGETQPVMIAANTSLGIALMQRLSAIAASVLVDWDCEIAEVHHRNKLDAPSGTALSLAHTIAGARQAMQRGTDIVTDRSQRRGKRPDDEIGVVSLRGGTVAGEHRIDWFGAHEQFEMKHVAESREIFANGARRLGKWLSTKPAGVYTIDHFLDEILMERKR